MGETSIEWARYTFNPWRGCTKVEDSPACDHCYAEKMSHRNPKVLGIWGDDGVRAIGAESYWKGPLRWAAEARALGRRERVFCASLADVGEDRPELVEPRARLCELIDKTADALVWMLLTKRIENIPKLFPREILERCGVGVTTENQPQADARIAKLIVTPARWRFISAEPLLSEILIPTVFMRKLNWGDGPKDWPDGGGVLDLVIAGGETDGRPSHPDWFRSLRDQCERSGVAFFFKQHGDWRQAEDGDQFNTLDGRAGRPPAFLVKRDGTVHCSREGSGPDAIVMLNVGKKAAGRLLDGREWNEMPEVAR